MKKIIAVSVFLLLASRLVSAEAKAPVSLENGVAGAWTIVPKGEPIRGKSGLFQVRASVSDFVGVRPTKISFYSIYCGEMSTRVDENGMFTAGCRGRKEIPYLQYSDTLKGCVRKKASGELRLELTYARFFRQTEEVLREFNSRPDNTDYLCNGVFRDPILP